MCLCVCVCRLEKSERQIRLAYAAVLVGLTEALPLGILQASYFTKHALVLGSMLLFRKRALTLGSMLRLTEAMPLGIPQVLRSFFLPGSS